MTPLAEALDEHPLTARLAAMADDLVFEVGFDPERVRAMAVTDLVFWHTRAVRYFKARNEAAEAQARR